jgi:hypothetical protein
MIRLALSKVEVQLEVAEPRNAGINVLALEDPGQVLIVFF